MPAQAVKSKFLSLEDILQAIRANRETLVRMGASRIGLFGSFARGESSATSDIDLLVEFAEGKKTFDNFTDLCFFLEELFGRNVDVLTPASLSPHLKQQIEAEVRFEKLQ
ncbi:MAG: nucleotidyltransferase [Deltaproteobacteria bacterium]|nr:MAG: nucleotidyltransferase [Deltaproteobacteria bacterium]